MKSNTRINLGDLSIKLWLVVIILAIINIVYDIPDNDAYFLAATGRYIAQNNFKIPTINPFVIHSNFKIIIQQWIPCILNWLLLDYTGFTGVAIYMVINALCIIGLLCVYIKNSPSNNNRKICVSSVLSICMICCAFMNTRPTHLTLLVVTCWLMILDRYKKKHNKKDKLLWLLPVLSILCINIHAAMWPILFVLGGTYILPSNKEDLIQCIKYIRNFVKDRLVLIKWFIISIIVGVINPNGIKGVTYLISSLSQVSTNKYVGEMKSPNLSSFYGIVVVASIIILIIYIVQYKKLVDYQLLIMAIGTIFMSMNIMRNIAYITFSIPVMLNIIVRDNYYIIDKCKKHERLNMISFTASLMLLFSLVLNIADIKLELEDDHNTPLSAIEYLDNSNIDEDKIILYNDYNNGGYIEFRGYKVYIDQRAESFDKHINEKYDVFTEYTSIIDGKGYNTTWSEDDKIQLTNEEFINKYKFNFMLTEDDSPINYYLLDNDNNWDLVVDGDDYNLFERKE